MITASNIRIATMVCTLCAITWAALTHGSGALAPAPMVSVKPTDSNSTITAKPNGNLTHRAYFTFSDRDLKAYEQVFALQKKAEWQEANRWVQQIKNPVLLPDVLAQRFLHEDYDSGAQELSKWLQRFGDHPDAARINQLALRKSVSHLPQLDITRPLSGGGIRDGINGKTMPRAWQAGLEAWEEGEYDSALETFALISNEKDQSPWHKAGAAFWGYRAAMAGGQKSRADVLLHEAASYPFTFYGALATQMIGLPLAQEGLPALNDDIIANPALERAAAFAAMGKIKKAERELRYMYPRLPVQQRESLITAAAKLELPALQLRMSQMLHKDPTQSHVGAYPTPQWVPHYDMIVDPALVYAIIRQESNFIPQAKSPAGAMGAMQVMPQTARYIIRRDKLDAIKVASLDTTHRGIRNEDLMRPDINVLVGQHYIKYLQDKPYIQGNIIYLLAAYNAGPGTLVEWQKRFGEVDDPLLFIEKIPYKETRHYVKQVMANYLIYQSLLYKAPISAKALMRNEWPAVPERDIISAMLPRELASR